MAVKIVLLFLLGTRRNGQIKKNMGKFSENIFTQWIYSPANWPNLLADWIIRWQIKPVRCQKIKTQTQILFSSNRPTGPIRSSSRIVCVFVPFPCDFFRGLSLALRSHDQIPASHWSTPSPPPTSRSRISKIFRDSESLGKSNGKKWSQI